MIMTWQGVAVFVFYCLYNTNIRQALWRVLHGQSLNESASNSSSQQKMKKRRMSIKKATQKKLSIVKAHVSLCWSSSKVQHLAFNFFKKNFERYCSSVLCNVPAIKSLNFRSTEIRLLSHSVMLQILTEVQAP